MPRLPPPLVPVTRALAELVSAARLGQAQTCPVREAEGLVLAEPLRAEGAVPPQGLALRDGVAVVASETVGATPYSPAFLAAAPRQVAVGEPMPAGTNAVLAPEAVAWNAGLAEVSQSAAPGEGVRRIGEDAAANAILRAAGKRLRAIDVAVALAAGIETCAVRRPRVRLMRSSASELCEPIVHLVGRVVVGAGASLERDPEADLGDAGCDLVLVLGNPGGAQGLATEAGQVIAHGLAVRPGETGACGIWRNTPAVVLPLRLDAALAVLLTIVLPCLDHLAGANPRRPDRMAPLTRKIVSTIGFTELVLLRQGEAGLEPLATAALSLTAMAAADFWLAIPPESEGVAAGEQVEAFSL